MPVYVDRAMIPYRGMLMSHMIADTPEELHRMAARLGLRREWYQNGASFPHYDVCSRKRSIAVNMGAIELSRREIGAKMREIRSNGLGTAWNIVR